MDKKKLRKVTKIFGNLRKLKKSNCLMFFKKKPDKTENNQIVFINFLFFLNMNVFADLFCTVKLRH